MKTIKVILEMNGQKYVVEYLASQVYAYNLFGDAVCMSPTSQWMKIAK